MGSLAVRMRPAPYRKLARSNLLSRFIVAVFVVYGALLSWSTFSSCAACIAFELADLFLTYECSLFIDGLQSVYTNVLLNKLVMMIEWLRFLANLAARLPSL
jgi:hypothetical protein